MKRFFQVSLLFVWLLGAQQPGFAQTSPALNEFADALARLTATIGAAPPSAQDALLRAVDALAPGDFESALASAKKDSYALGLVLLRQAKFYAHTRQDDLARVTLTRFFDQAPKHPLTAQAKALETSLTAAKAPAAMKIGVLLPLTGEYRRLGEMLYAGIELAAKEALSQNPDLEIIVRDTQSTPEGANQEMEMLVREKNVLAVVGPFAGGESRAAAYKASELGVPIVLLSPKEGLTDIGPQVFRLALTPEIQAKALVSYAFDVLGKREFAILEPQHAYGETMAAAFFDEVIRRGGRVTGYERYDDWETTFSTMAQRLVGRYRVAATDAGGGPCKDNEGFHCARVYPLYPKEDRASVKAGKVMLPRVDFDALFIPDSAERVAMVLAALAVEEADFDQHLDSDYARITRKEHDAGYKIRPIQLLGSDRWNATKLMDHAGKYARGSVFVDGYWVDESNPRAGAFEKAFSAAAKSSPNAAQAGAYDALSLVAGLATAQKPASREAMQELIKATTAYVGATALDLHTDERGEIIGTPTLLTVKDGAIDKITPPPPSAEQTSKAAQP